MTKREDIAIKTSNSPRKAYARPALAKGPCLQHNTASPAPTSKSS